MNNARKQIGEGATKNARKCSPNLAAMIHAIDWGESLEGDVKSRATVPQQLPGYPVICEESRK
jgi:hypothetical protein